MRKKFIEYKLHIILVISLLCLGSVVYGLTQQATSTTTERFVMVVKPGMGANGIGHLLYEKGAIKSVFLFQMISKMQGMESSLQAGEYVINKNMTMQQIIGMLSKGETTYQQITIPEGYTVEQIGKLLQEKQLGNAATFKKIAQNFVPHSYMINNNPDVVYKAEGYMFPNTYRLSKGMTEEQILGMMTSQFDKEFTESMRSRATEMNLSVKNVIILASLVEKEAQLPADRPIIAGVFLNRLKLDMPLQSCATIQYILGYPKAELSVQDTEIPSPYNTYQHMGLPPGPIANPGIAAIKAVLYPEKTEYVYFVADKNGAHHFSKTYDEHLVAIEQVINNMKTTEILFQEMEKYAEEHAVPIINKVSSQLLIDITQKKAPQSVLEIGTAIGYSALLMINHMPIDGKIVTIEQDANRVDTAHGFITRAGRIEQIQLLDGDASEILEELEGTFDMVFIDAAKGQYLDYLQKIIDNLAKDAVIIADNVLFRGMVLGQEPPLKRYKTIVKRLREYIDFVSSDPRFSTTIHHEGDGVAISYYLGGNKE